MTRQYDIFVEADSENEAIEVAERDYDIITNGIADEMYSTIVECRTSN